MEHGVPGIKMENALKTRIQARFKKEHPEFESDPPDQPKPAELSDEDKGRLEILMHEVVARCSRARKEHSSAGKKKTKLSDKELERIIGDAKYDLGIDLDVSKTDIRDRLQRKSEEVVMTSGDTSSYDAIDEPLVATINNWLSQGISVTRAQGLELANALLKERNIENDDQGQAILLDEIWWRNFLERNREKINCESSNDA